MSEDLYSQHFHEQELYKVAEYFQATFQNPAPLATDMEIYAQQLNNPRQKTIRIDCLRTRSPIFSQEIKKQLERMLTHYIRISGIQYKQGLNEIAAPFIYLRKADVPINKCQVYFHLFFKGYCLNFYDDKDFNSLDLFVKMFQIVLKYHDPSLYRYLHWYQIQPQIFCIGWLMTLFANKVSFKMVYILWQFLITEKDKFLLFFLVLAIVMNNKQNIIETKNAHILTIVTNLIFKSTQQLQIAIERSLLLRKNTPNSLVKFFRDRMVFQKRKSFEDLQILTSNIQNIQYFLVLPSQISLQSHLKVGLCQEVCYLCDIWKPVKIPNLKCSVNKEVQKLLNLSNDIRTMKYYKQFVIVDLRKDKQQNIGYNGEIFLGDTSRNFKQIQQHFIGRFIQQKSKKHFVFMLTNFNFEAPQLCDQDQLQLCKQLLNSLISFSFPLLGMLEGGSKAFQQYNLAQQKNQINIHEEPKSFVFNQFIDLPSIFLLKLSDRFKLGTGLIGDKYWISYGLMQTLIIIENIIVIVENNKQLNHFGNYFAYNSCILNYLYQHPSSPQQLNICKIIPLKRLKKASMKVHNQNIMVLVYNSCEHTQKSWFKTFSNLLQFGIYDVLQFQMCCKECKMLKKKIILQMHAYEQVQDCVKNLTHSYSVMNKKIKLVTNQLL